MNSKLHFLLYSGAIFVILAFMTLIYFGVDMRNKWVPIFKMAEPRPPKLKVIRKPLSSCSQVWTGSPGDCQESIPDDLSTFSDILLAINFNHPYYQTISILLEYYKSIFPNYVICGPETDPVQNQSIIVIQQSKPLYGYYGYQCLVEAIKRNPGHTGYLYVNDDMVVNWWNLVKLNRSKIWFPDLSEATRHVMGKSATGWWVYKANCLIRCTDAFLEMKKDSFYQEMGIFDNYSNNFGNSSDCIGALSDFVYIPKRLSKKFEAVGQKFYDHRLFLEVAVPMAIVLLDRFDNFETIHGLYLQKKYGWYDWTGNSERAWENYDFKTNFLHPYKFHGENFTKNTKEFKDRVLWVSNTIWDDRCLDVLSIGSFWKNRPNC